MKRDDLMWLAGFLEGEGCFAYYEYHRTEIRHGQPYAYTQHIWQIIVSSAYDVDVIERAAELIGAPVRTSSQKQMVVRLGRAADVIALCRLLQPHMSKRRQAKIQEMIDAWEIHNERKAT